MVKGRDRTADNPRKRPPTPKQQSRPKQKIAGASGGKLYLSQSIPVDSQRFRALTVKRKILTVPAGGWPRMGPQAGHQDMHSQPGITNDNWAKRFGPWLAAIATVFAIVGGLVTAIYFVGDGKYISKPAYAQDLASHAVEHKACDERIAGTELNVATIKARLDAQAKSFDSLAGEVRDLTQYLRDKETRDRRRR